MSGTIELFPLETDGSEQVKYYVLVYIKIFYADGYIEFRMVVKQ